MNFSTAYADFFSKHLFEISRVLAYTIFTHALRFAEKPLFAPDDDEAWRVKLRELNILLHEGDPDGAKKAAMRHLNGIVRTVIVDHATNRYAVARGMYRVCNLWEGAIAGKNSIDDDDENGRRRKNVIANSRFRKRGM